MLTALAWPKKPRVKFYKKMRTKQFRQQLSESNKQGFKSSFNELVKRQLNAITDFEAMDLYDRNIEVRNTIDQVSSFHSILI